MNVHRSFVAVALFIAAAVPLSASGPLGIYGIVEKVVFEPNEESPARLQVWGAFVYADGATNQSLSVSPPKRGYLYFRMPSPADGGTTAAELKAVTTEWADLKAVAGTGQTVAFGRWGYIGGFSGLLPDTRTRNPPYILEHSPGNPTTDLRVRPASEAPAAPALYQTNTGIVKLSDSGSHAAIVKQLKDALKR